MSLFCWFNKDNSIPSLPWRTSSWHTLTFLESSNAAMRIIMTQDSSRDLEFLQICNIASSLWGRVEWHEAMSFLQNAAHRHFLHTKSSSWFDMMFAAMHVKLAQDARQQPHCLSMVARQQLCFLLGCWSTTSKWLRCASQVARQPNPALDIASKKEGICPTVSAAVCCSRFMLEHDKVGLTCWTANIK